MERSMSAACTMVKRDIITMNHTTPERRSRGTTSNHQSARPGGLLLLLLCGRGEGAPHVGGVGGGWFEARWANPNPNSNPNHNPNPNPNPNPLTFALVAQVEEAVARLEDGLGQLQRRALG